MRLKHPNGMNRTEKSDNPLAFQNACTHLNTLTREFVMNI